MALNEVSQSEPEQEGFINGVPDFGQADWQTIVVRVLEYLKDGEQKQLCFAPAEPNQERAKDYLIENGLIKSISIAGNEFRGFITPRGVKFLNTGNLN